MSPEPTLTEASTAAARPLTRRAFLLRGGLAVAGLAAGLGAASTVVDSWRDRPLTASALEPLVGTTLQVAFGGIAGRATVRPLEGLGVPVQERSFELTLMSDADLPPVGGLVTVQHADLGQHQLFMSPTRDARQWVAVISERKG